jgi:RHS repeat-associated protein
MSQLSCPCPSSRFVSSTMRQPLILKALRSAALALLALAALPGSGLAKLPGPMHFRDQPETASPLAAQAGVTAVTGRVLSNDGHPLANVALRDGGVGTRTNDQGWFLIEGVKPGLSILTIDGRHADRDGKTDFGLFEAQIEAKQGQTVSLGYTSYLPKIDHAHEVSFPSPTTSEVVVKAFGVPGLELHIPKGAIITDTDGKVVTKIGITAIPIDKAPFPLPKDAEVPVYFTAQPGGATITSADGSWLGFQVYYPNYRHELPKARGAFYRYDPFGNGWETYGYGQVSADGTQVVPDATTRIYDLTGAMFNFGQALANLLGCNCDAADPVDLASGRWREASVDLAAGDILPLAATRTYLSGDFNSRDFGVGQNLNYALSITSSQPYQEADLGLPDGSQIHFTRIPDGNPPSNGYTDAVLVNNDAGPSPFYKSRIFWNGDGFTLTRQDGLHYVFGSNAPLQWIQDRYGNRITLIRAGIDTGPITQVISPNGRSVSFTRDSSNRITQATDNAGRRVSYSYDSAGRMQSVTDADGGVTTYGWDSANHINSVTDPRGNVVVTNVYDADDRVVTQTLADGATSHFAYTGGGSNSFVTQAQVTDPIGSVEVVNFNASGYAGTISLAAGTAVEQDYSVTRDPSSNLVLSSTDALGRVTAFGYDGIGNITNVTLLSGTSNQASSQFSYGKFRQLASATDPLGNVTEIGLDALGTPVSVTDAAGDVTSLAYGPAPYLTQITDPLGNQTSATYDTGLLASVTNPLGNVSTLYRDAVGRTIRETDPLGNAGTIAYDPIYGARQITQPKGEMTTITYLPGGLVGSVVDARTGATSYAYDAKRRLTTRTDPLGKTDQITSYDGNDNVLTRIDRKGQTATYTYDALNRISTATYADGAVVSYSFDKGDRLTQIQDSSAGTITRSYDGLDRLVSETTPPGTVSYTYDAAGNRTSLSVPGQAPVTYTYDPVNRPIQITQGSATVTIGYDADSRRTSLTLPNGIVASYDYDAASQLTGISYAPGNGTALGNLLYSYDGTGQQITRTGSLFQSVLPASVTSGSYDVANRLTQWTTPGGANSPSYDANGNLLSDGTHTYSWDARNRLISISGVASFTYDAAGRRQVATINGSSVASLYDGSDPVQEQSGGAALANILIGFGVDERFTRTEGTNSSTYLTDALGSSVALTDSTGTIRTSYGYDPYGNTGATGTANDNSYQYAGRQNDGTGLYFNRARYYNPAWGRFISEDPIGLAGGINRYVYVVGNPLNFTDPTGYGPEGRLAGAAIGGALGEALGEAGGAAGGTALEPGGGTVLGGIEGGIEGEEFGSFVGAEVGSKIQDAISCDKPTEPYNRKKHYGNTPTAADRKAVGAGDNEVADHDPPLVQRYYEGDPSTGEAPGFQMTPEERANSAGDLTRMSPQSRADSNAQGGQMSKYSKLQKEKFGF